MRAEIQQSGESLLGCGELNLLCLGELSENRRWNMIAEIAMNEGWSFTFFPDDSVRFAKLPPCLFRTAVMTDPNLGEALTTNVGSLTLDRAMEFAFPA